MKNYLIPALFAFAAMFLFGCVDSGDGGNSSPTATAQTISLKVDGMN